jgi:enoyl-CoA hydratase/carnithine racemase
MAIAPMFETVLVAAEERIGRITLNRPARLNAMNRLLLREVAEATRWLDQQPNVKVVVVTGAGRAFSAGFDLTDFVNPDPGISIRDGADLGRVMAESLSGMRALTIAAIRGRCVGGGLVLAAACDLRIVAADAVFSIPEIDLGIPLAWGGIPRLVREIGPAMTKELVLTCRTFGAEEARALHFVNRVVPLAVLDEATMKLAEELAAKSSLTLAVTKRHVNAVAEEMGSTAHAGADADVLVSALHDEESRAVGRAYLERMMARKARKDSSSP